LSFSNHASLIASASSKSFVTPTCRYARSTSGLSESYEGLVGATATARNYVEAAKTSWATRL
jgi:hypothetical protein